LYACVEEVCHLSAQLHFDTFHQHIIVEALWGGSHSEWDQGCKKGGQTAPSWSAPAVLECEQLYADVHCHGGALHRMSAFDAFCSKWPYAVFLLFCSTLLMLL
jgi:hypothetical protein